MVMVKGIGKGVLCAVIITLLFILSFSFIVQICGLGNGVITPVMQVVKVVSIFIAVAIAIKTIKSKAWLYGGLIGLLYMVITFLIFSMLDGKFIVDMTALSDLLFEVLAGVVSAILIRMRNKDVEVV